MKKLLIAFFVILSLESCSAGADGSSGDENAAGKESYITATIDGCDYTFTKGHTDIYPGADSYASATKISREGNPDSTVITAMVMETAHGSWTDDATNEGIEIFFFGAASGEYYEASSCDVEVMMYHEGIWYDSYDNAITISVSNYGEVGGFIDGTFSTTVTNMHDSNDSFSVSGSFHVHRIGDYSGR